jgi:tetratricopeptide (TPR) repeat protein
MRLQSSLARFLASAAVTAILAAGLGGCQTMSDITGSITAKPETPASADPRGAAEKTGDRYRENPKDADAALAYGQALRAAWGRALTDNGNFQQAFDVLSRAHTPDNPDWRILSVQGTALDQLGRHEEARGYYASALKIVPGEPSVLSNLGLSYMLTRDLPKAEQVLRQAYASPRADARVRQNLGLVVGLQGRFAEAETIVKADLPPEEAAANVAYLKEMLNRKDNPRAGRGTIPVAALSRNN